MLSLMPPKKTAAPDSPAQLAFSPLRFRHARHQVSVQDAADALGIREQHVRDLVDLGELGAAPINAQTQQPQREHVRILRPTVEAWWLENWLLKNGTEYPFNNSEEIKWWRAHLRALRSKQPS